MSKILSIALLTLLLPSQLAIAAEEVVNVESIQQFASLIRWSGVFFSILVIAATWLLIKFMNSMVESIGGQFVQYRMVLQKVQSFLQFFIYMTAGLVVFMMSFRINDHILALIGGTLAVSVGFALKDLAASF
ncbi:mechanosensitive ion channel family protein, partial [Vibrio fortis]